MPRELKVGVIGGGLMGREVASAFGRWFALVDCPVVPRLVAVADLNPVALAWFRQVPTVGLLAQDYRELLADPAIDVVYVAVPHDQHARVYADVLEAGKDLLAEKPFGIDLDAAEEIAGAAARLGRFVRCSSEFPFFPGARRVAREVTAGKMGRVLQIVSAFRHSSDLDPEKPANWKRLSATCGRIGVMGDLGMHVLHVPLRLGWTPRSVYAQLQKGYPRRPDGRGGTAACDTWDNAQLHTVVAIDGADVPMRLEMLRLSPGDTDSWSFEVLGTEGAARFSTREPRTFWSFERGEEQAWRRVDLGFQTEFPTITGGIFEPGFPDILMQMWAAFLLEREGLLDGRFGCVTPDEAVLSHRVFAAALESAAHASVVPVVP